MISRKALSVAWWEFIERARKKSYIIGLFLTPSIFLLFWTVPFLLESSLGDSESETVIVYDGTGRLYDSLRANLTRAFRTDSDAPLYNVREYAPADRTSHEAVAAELDRLVLADSVSAAILIPADVFDSLHVEYRSRNAANIRATERIERVISDLLVNERLRRKGFDPVLVLAMNQRADLRSVRVTESGVKESGFLQSFGLSYMLLIMLLILVLTSGQMLVRSMVEEKSNRIVEVLVSSCSPTELMFGKILGLSCLGFGQMLTWLVMGLAVVLITGVTGLPLEHLWLLGIYFVLGFLLYASIFVAFGCLASTEQEAQQMTGYLSLFFTLPLLIATVATQSPNHPVFVIASLIPLITPSMMIVRLPIIAPPAWEIALTIVIMVLSIAFMIWIAAKIFRVGILLTGKRPSLDEIVRWIRS